MSMSELIEKRPVRATNTVSVPAGGSATARLSVPGGRRYYIKQVNITKGANTSIAAHTIDGVETTRAASYDCETTFGTLLSAEGVIELAGSNAGAAAEDLTLEVFGFAVVL